MDSAPRFEAVNGARFEVLWVDGDRVFGRGASKLAVWLRPNDSSECARHLLEQEYGLRDYLHPGWAAVPTELARVGGSTVLYLQDPGGQPLAMHHSRAMPAAAFLRFAIAVAMSLGKMHNAGLIHRNLKPAHILFNEQTGAAHLTGFSFSMPLGAYQAAPVSAPGDIVGTPAYMAPEQSGRSGHRADARSDLYSLGVVFYEALTGELPFQAESPLTWLHSHTARVPVAPAERNAGICAELSAIVMKLLEKSADDRYQTAEGLAADLQCCLTTLTAGPDAVPDFVLGRYDHPGRVRVPATLYGRGTELDILLGAMGRVAGSGRAEVVLISGEPGVGKSILIEELHRVVGSQYTLLAKGKGDPHSHAGPYAALVEAARGLLQAVLAKNESDLDEWREKLRVVVSAGGDSLLALIPELAMIVPDASGLLAEGDAKARLRLAFQHLFCAFSSPGHPLILFLDDLQSTDAATLRVIDQLAQTGLQNILVVGVYRAEDMAARHALAAFIDSLRANTIPLTEIALNNLHERDSSRLIADALQSKSPWIDPLVSLVQAKTAGNPCFMLRFLATLTAEGLLHYAPRRQRWIWDAEAIREQAYTDNVVGIIIQQVERLPADSREAIQHMACLGHDASLDKLAVALDWRRLDVATAMRECERQSLVFRTGDVYRFPHDRVQAASYALIPERQRAATHLAIGRRLGKDLEPEQLKAHAFELVDQFNRAWQLVHSPEERVRLAHLNALAGALAKDTADYSAAIRYLEAASAFLSDDGRQHQPALAFTIEITRAECEFRNGAVASAKHRLARLGEREGLLPEQARVTQLRVEVLMALGERHEAIGAGLHYLRRAGIDWTDSPSDEVVASEYAEFNALRDGRPAAALLGLPEMQDAEAEGTMGVLTALLPPAWTLFANLRERVILRMAILSLRHGNTDASSLGYAWLGMILAARTGDYADGYAFGKLGVDLIQQRGQVRFSARVYQVFGGQIVPWSQPVSQARDLLQTAFELASLQGDWTYASFALNSLVTHMLVTGGPLNTIRADASRGLAFARKAGLEVLDRYTSQLQLAKMLQGLTTQFGSLDDAGFSEAEFERKIQAEPGRNVTACWHYLRKLQARVYAGDFTSAVRASQDASAFVWTSLAFIEEMEFHFYSALARAWCPVPKCPSERAVALAAVEAHLEKLRPWAASSPSNFQGQQMLIDAEVARLNGDVLDAMQRYDDAIRCASDHGLVHVEGLANECAARFFESRGQQRIAHTYLQHARACYQHWGATGKVRQIDALYPTLFVDRRSAAQGSTIETPVESLDLSTVIDISRALASALDLQTLLDKLMKIALEQAGATRGVLVLQSDGELYAGAIATTSGDSVEISQRAQPLDEAGLPQQIVNYGWRTGETIVLDDAWVTGAFTGDPYVRAARLPSVLCLSLTTQSKSIGVLYLENTLARGVFAPHRTAVLRLLASQAAIAIERARLYRDLAQREARIQRLVEANIIGIWFWSTGGQVLEANDLFLTMTGYDREDVSAGRLRWTALVSRSGAVSLEELLLRETAEPVETELIRKDGRRVPVLLGSARFAADDNQGVSFVLDLSERKAADAKMQQIQSDLAHVTRMTTVSAMTASIAHDVSQPVSAVLTEAQAALNWIARTPPNTEEVAESLRRIVRSGQRAGSIISGVRALIKKAPAAFGPIDMNGLVKETLTLLRGELDCSDVDVILDLADGALHTSGDRVQLQQVLLNLYVNAVDAMKHEPSARRLTVVTRRASDDEVLVEVLDTGSGIDAASVKKLFDPFFTTKTKGLGMGLAICREIIQLHHGQMWARPNSPAGAVFYFSLPAQA
ncbi:AAA family ATPase [Achromobacter sp.]|uniref:AAA family ATPase n=1 Tax=Achromobacter sp. TaxID=134375 RepID=UPI0028A23BD3|nr:AAA family ATPase [Achromobacter sp.]